MVASAEPAMFHPPALALRGKRRTSMGFFGGNRPPSHRRHVPPEFEWVQIQMDITRWAITGAIGVAALGIWTGALRLNDLSYTMEVLQQSNARQEVVNNRQDTEIKELKTAITEHSVYLRQILEAVKREP